MTAPPGSSARRPIADACVALAVASIVGLAAGPTAAEPLPKEACELLVEEQSRLASAGARSWLAEGPAAARTRLAPAQVEQVRRLLEVDEQLLFGCGLFKARFALPRDVDDPEPEAKEKAKEPAAAKPKRRQRQAPKDAAPAAAAAAAEGSGTESAKAAPAAVPAEAAPKAASRRKQRPEDAYRPPAPQNPEN